ncbi:hypothetical protein [Nocardia gipuzkoensis]|uniref:hypothetical protein n=1 Tax=Nocardia gipuzkoensis TaxID=2749991 RepID=UPI00237E31F5|nr:hypothetical protein [Nocardia gipuzkoensis]MDE1673813.1 hypothetical protein [Nocardia gipuzkoensis]
MHFTVARRKRLTILRVSATVGGAALLIGALGAANVIPLPTAAWIAALVIAGMSAGTLWAVRSTPASRELEDAHAALIARCEQLTGQSNPYMAVDSATKQSIAVRAEGKYTVTVGSVDGDIAYDPDTMRNLHFATVTTYYIGAGAAGAAKRIEAATLNSGDAPERFMDRPEPREHSRKELRAIASEAGDLLFATAQEMRQLTALLDTARPIEPPDDN